MQRTVFVLAFSGLVILGSSMCDAQLRLGQNVRQQFSTSRVIQDAEFFNPDVTTIWHRLGVAQGLGRIRRFRDSRINRDGLSPELERKPPLLRLTDPKNLEADAPEMLKAAAKMKIDADLAPQKIKALRYICQVGCSCQDKKLKGLVTKAVKEGLEDCTVDVRKAALQLILANNSSSCSCTDSCETCCNEEIREKLQEMLKMNDKGCYNEPDESVRMLAEQALNSCPVPITKPDEIDDDGKNNNQLEGENKEKKKKNKLEGEGNGELQEESTDPNVESPSPDNTTVRSSRRQSNPFYQVAARNSKGSAWNDPALAELQIRGVIESLHFSKSDALIIFDQPYEFPIGSQVVIALDDNHVSMGSIVVSQTGKALVHIDDARLVDVLDKAVRIRMGILEN